MPVLPEVGSRMVLSGVRSPDRSASSIMATATRSFSEPVGFWPSSLAQSLTDGRGDSRWMPTSGVFPTAPRMSSARIRTPQPPATAGGIDTTSPSRTSVSSEPRYRTSSSFTYTLTNRWRAPSPVISRARIPGYRDSRSSSTSRTVVPSPSTWPSPPVCDRRTDGTFTRTGTVSHSGRGRPLRLRRRLPRGQPAERLVVDQLGHRGVLPAHGAVRIPPQLHRGELVAHRVVQHQRAGQGLPHVEDELDGLHGLDRADDPGEHAEHAALGARGHRPGRRRLREQAPVARRVLPGQEHAGLPLPLVDRAVHQRLPEHLAGVVDQVPHRKIVGAVDDHVVWLEHLEGVLARQQDAVRDHVDVRVEIVEPVTGRLDLGPADVVGIVKQLALEVRQLHLVEVHEPDGAHAGGGQVHRRRRAEPTGPDHQHAGLFQPALAVAPDPREDDVAGGPAGPPPPSTPPNPISPPPPGPPPPPK